MPNNKVVKWGRRVVAVLFAWFCIAIGYQAFTVPAIVATPYLILAIVCGFAAYIAWPKRKSNPA